MHRPGYCLERSGTEVSPPACTPKPFHNLAICQESISAQHRLVAKGAVPRIDARFELFSLEGGIRHADRWFRERERGFRPVCMQNVYLMSG